MKNLWLGKGLTALRKVQKILRRLKTRLNLLPLSARWLYRNRSVVFSALWRRFRHHHSQALGATSLGETYLSKNPVRYINLDRRPDRKAEFENQAALLGITVERFAAVDRVHGHLGCVESHIQLLEKSLRSGSSKIFIAEDDLEFLVGKQELDEIFTEFDSLPDVDVLCLAHNSFGLKVPVSQNISISHSIFTTAGYVGRPKSIRVLLEYFRKSKKLQEAGAPPSVAAIDVIWQEAQVDSLVFGVTRKRVCRQRESYSDLANRIKNYGV